MIKSDKVSTLAVTADGKYAISGSVGKTLRVWSLEKLYDIRLKASGTCVVRFSVQYKGRKQDSGNIT